MVSELCVDIAALPILVTESGMERVVSDAAAQKAVAPILVTELGIVRDVNIL